MVRLGVIGLGTEWDSRHRDALERLRERTSVTAVFDPVPANAEQAAAELGVAMSHGLVATARRCDVDALLLLDSGWYGVEALRLLCSANKPVYIAADVGRDAPTLHALHWTAMSYGQTLMPEFPLRYTPASSRLQELIATRLGPPTRVRVDLATADFREESFHSGSLAANRQLLHWFDWLRYVARGIPRSVQADRSTVNGEFEIRVQVEFARTTGCLSTELRLLSDDNGPRERPEIDGERGTAVIESPTDIRWDSGDDSNRESLTADRNETEVMLDHFCRRVVGGLIPVADLSDISQGQSMVDALWQSFDNGTSVMLQIPGDSAA